MSLSELLDRPIAFQRAFVRLNCGIPAALFLSQAIYWHNRTKDDGKWFYKSQIEWEEETGLTRYEQEGARAKLIKAGVLEELRRGVPAKLYYRVNMKALRASLIGEIPQTGLGELPNQEGGFSPNKPGENAQSNIGTETTAETTAETTTDIVLAGPVGRSEAVVDDDLDGPKDPNAKTYATWHAYAATFAARHGVRPKWNRAVGGMLAQVVGRLGAEDAPRAAEFYVTMNNSFYAQRMHPVSLLLRDCETIYAQFCTGRTMTSTRARQIDRQEANRGTVDDAMNILFGSQAGAQGDVIDA